MKRILPPIFNCLHSKLVKNPLLVDKNTTNLFSEIFDKSLNVKYFVVEGVEINRKLLKFDF